jgi:hypothetical protein
MPSHFFHQRREGGEGFCIAGSGRCPEILRNVAGGGDEYENND